MTGPARTRPAKGLLLSSTRLARPVGWVGVVLLLAGGGAAPVLAQNDPAPALQFTSPTEFRVHPEVNIVPRDTPAFTAWAVGYKPAHFDALSARQAGTDSLTFTVEGQVGPSREYCFEGRCGAMGVASTPGGHLYINADIGAPRRGDMKSNLEDFPAQRVEVAVQAGSQKVYREVVVDAPATAPDCSDYSEWNEDRFRCYYTREYLPAAAGDPALVADLPGLLVQDRAEYAVVFAEEFTGDYTPAADWPDHCDRGLADLDGNKWNYRARVCRRAWEGLPCQYLKDGHLHLVLNDQCTSGTHTSGSFEPRYGYVEVRYTIQTTNAPFSFRQYRNFNIVMGDPRRPGRHLLSAHNVELDSLERYLTLVPWLELDFFEYVPDGQSTTSHQYRNWGLLHHNALPPLRTSRRRTFCRGIVTDGILHYRPPNCGDTSKRITITEGMEWTPGGYLFLRRVHGLHDELAIPSREGTVIEAATWRNNRWHTGEQDRRTISGAERAGYFVELDSADPTFYLDTVGIIHAPISSSVGAWGWGFSSRLRNWVGVTIDYIRVFQPRNRYADMEPLYR